MAAATPANALDNFNTSALPPYTSATPEGHVSLEKGEDPYGKIDSQEVNVIVFGTNARPHSDASAPMQSWGRLEIGTQIQCAVPFEGAPGGEFGIAQHAVYYKPPKLPGSSIVPEESDISADMRIVREAGEKRLHMRKAFAPSTTQYSFDIWITDAGTESASFIGTLTCGETVHDWEGEAITKRTKSIAKSVFELPAPGALTGTPAGLRDISPIATKTDDKVKQGEDSAQVYGNEFINKIMYHALKDETRKKLLLSVPNLPPAEQKILNANRDYLERRAIHTLADQLKDLDGVDDKIKQRITYKRRDFDNMVTAIDPPPAGSKVADPVVIYGLDRAKDAETIKKLQKQFIDANMRCYELGYTIVRPDWSDYTKQPAYWFKYLSWYLLSDAHLAKWRANAIDRDESAGTLSVSQEILLWGNKLSLLKQAASEEEAKELNIEYVTNQLDFEAQMSMAYTQRLNNQFASEIKLVYEKLEKSKDTEEFRKRFADVNKEAREIHAGMMVETADIVHRLASPEHGLVKAAQHFWAARRPPALAQQPVEAIAQIEMAVVDAAGAGARAGNVPAGEWDNFVALFDDIPMPEANPGTAQRIANRFRNIKWGKMLQGVLKAAAVVMVVNNLVSQAMDPDTPAGQLGLSITMAVSEGLRIAGWGISKLLTRFAAGNQIAQRIVGWLGDAARAGQTWTSKVGHAFVGNLGKILRIVGLIGSIYSIYNAFWELNRAHEIDPEHRQSFRVYNWIQVSLGIVEAFLVIGSIYAEIMAITTGFMACTGPLAVVVGLIGLGVMIVYHIWFAPDPMADVRSFLNAEAKPIGSYHEN